MAFLHHVDLRSLKRRCCPNAQPAVPRSIHEVARDIARAIAESEAGEISRASERGVEIFHLKRFLRLDRLRLRASNGTRDEFLLAAAAQNLRKGAKLVAIAQPARP
jgi:hypothetical protein